MTQTHTTTKITAMANATMTPAPTDMPTTAAIERLPFGGVGNKSLVVESLRPEVGGVEVVVVFMSFFTVLVDSFRLGGQQQALLPGKNKQNSNNTITVLFNP